MTAVAYASPFVPPEWIEAHGLAPRRIFPDGDEDPASEGLCAVAGGVVRWAGNPDADALVMTTTCDQMRRSAERIPAGRLPVFLMNVPVTWQTGAARRLYRDELLRLGRFLERAGGTRPSDGRLREVLRASALRRAPASKQAPESRATYFSTPVPTSGELVLRSGTA